MSITLKQFASGYRSYAGATYPANSVRIENQKHGDEQLAALIKLMPILRLDNMSSLHKLEFIDCAKRLFGNFDDFLLYNLEKNNLIHGKELDFLVDTAEFINGGIRSLSIQTWGNYLDQKPKKPGYDQRLVNLNVPRVGPNYIGKWLRQPNGFADLVSTLILMFGIRLDDPRQYKNGLI